MIYHYFLCQNKHLFANRATANPSHKHQLFYPIMAGVSALMQATYCWIKERTVFESKMEPAHFNTGHLARESENYLANKQTVQRHGA